MFRKELHTTVKVFATFVFILLLTNAFSQNNRFTKVFGGVVDSDGSGIGYVTIQFLDAADSTTKFGTITKESGLFSLDSVLKSNYLLKVSSVGYKTVYRPADLEHAKNDTYLKVFELELDTLQLQDIEIKGKAKGYYQYADKTVFYPDSISLKSSRNSLELLSKIPEIQVNKKSGSVSVMGSGNVLILVNGIDNQRMIKAINPNDVEKIELITHPSAKYRSDVTSVVNVILKNKRQHGFSMFTDVSIGINQKNHLAMLQIAHTLKKWNFFINYNGMLYRSLSNDTTKRFESSQENKTNYLSIPLEKADFNSSIHRIQFGADFLPNKKTVLSFTGRIDLSGYSFLSKQKSSYTINNVENISKNGVYSESNSIQQNYSLFLKRKFSSKNSLSWSTNFYTLKNLGHSDISDTAIFTNPDQKIINSRHQQSDYHQESVNSQLDFEHDFTGSLKYEGGYRFYGRNINSNISSEGISSLLNYTEYRNELYSNIVGDYGKFGFQAGLRLESSVKFVYDTIKNNYNNLLPSLNFVYKPAKHQSLLLSYDKRLNYPSIYYLNPYEIYTPDSLSFSSGNPYLLPESTHKIELKYSYKRKNFNTSFSVEYNRIKNIIVEHFDMKNGVLSSKYKNIGYGNRYGLNVNTYAVLFNFIETESYFYLKYNSFPDNSDHNGFGYKAGISTYMMLPWDIDFDFTFLFGTKEIYYSSYETEHFLIDEISFSKDILKGNGSIGISVWEPVFRNITNEKKWTADFIEESISETTNNTVFLIEFTYNIKSGKSNKKVNKILYMENNSKDIK